MKKTLLGLSFVVVILALFLAGPDAPADDPQDAQEPTPAEGEPLAGEPLETFEPTEKLSPDSAVSFPVDI